MEDQLSAPDHLGRRHRPGAGAALPHRWPALDRNHRSRPRSAGENTAEGFSPRRPGRMHHTLYDKLWHDHVVEEAPDGTCLLYVDRHLVHEVDSPQAFAGLRRAGLPVRAPEKTLLVVDHNVPTSDRSKPNPDPESAAQIAYFAENASAVRPRILRRVRPAAGHLPRRRARAGFYVAGHHDRVRRQPHLDPRRLRCAGLWHRHLRGRACAGDADADPAQVEEHARGRRRQAAARRHRQGHDPRRSSARSAPPAPSAMRWNLAARRSARCRWKAA